MPTIASLASNYGNLLLSLSLGFPTLVSCLLILHCLGHDALVHCSAVGWPNMPPAVVARNEYLINVAGLYHVGVRSRLRVQGFPFVGFNWFQRIPRLPMDAPSVASRHCISDGEWSE